MSDNNDCFPMARLFIVGNAWLFSIIVPEVTLASDSVPMAILANDVVTEAMEDDPIATFSLPI